MNIVPQFNTIALLLKVFTGSWSDLLGGGENGECLRDAENRTVKRS